LECKTYRLCKLEEEIKRRVAYEDSLCYTHHINRYRRFFNIDEENE